VRLLPPLAVAGFLAAALTIVPTTGTAAEPTPEPTVETRPTAAEAPVAKPAKGPRLVVDLKKGKHRISPLVYGVNFAEAGFAKAVDLPVDRWGGNATETYNWQVRGSNRGQDYYFTNFADCWTAAFGYCKQGQDFSAADAQVQQDRSTRTKTLLTLPLMGWVAKAVSYAGDHPCSYPSSLDPQDAHDPYHPSCGNGRRGGQWLTADPTTAGVAVGPSFSAQWVSSLVQRYGDAAHGGVSVYALGNEPNLWDDTHHDFHPQPTTYDELWAKSRDLATAVKQADPTAKTLGPAEWGWPNYFCSAADDTDRGCSASSPDRAAHGGTELSAWYLQQFAAQERQTGRRLLDYFDLHYYPQGRYSPVTDVTRSLWDTDYTDPSWIGQKIGLVPRMRAWVEANYPGTRLGISEYNMALDVTGDPRLQNVIQADTLGILGREGVDLATFWPDGDSGVPEAAFRIFRNYDGKGHAFGDRGVSATSSDQRTVSVYAARVGKRGPLTLVVVNKATRALKTSVALQHARPRGKPKAYQYAGKQVRKVRSAKLRGRALRLSLPASSITLVQLPLRK
jgi:hypothetical protein